jgi:hypothetical protein
MKICSNLQAGYDPAWAKYLAQDPVHWATQRPNLESRLDNNREVFFLLNNENVPAAVLCASYSLIRPAKIAQIFESHVHQIIHNPRVVTFYSIFRTTEPSAEVGANRLIFGAAKYISETRPTVRVYQTLSPIPSLNLSGAEQKPEHIMEYIHCRKDSVSKFHLNNGAKVYKICYNADSAVNRVNESNGIMVNYDYSDLIK